MRLYRDLAEYYHAIESNHRDIRDDVAYLLSVTGSRENPAMLDIGCGSGEHMDALSRRGCRCTGVDASADMLRVARNRFPDSGRFIHRDMANIDFFEEFDLAYSLFGTINYITDDDLLDRVLWNVWRSIKPGGSAVFEVWNSFPILKIRRKVLSPISTTSVTGTVIERHRGFSLVEVEPRTIVEVNYRYVITRDGSSSELLDRHVMRAFTKGEITELLGANGFRVGEILGNSRRDPYAELSNKMLIRAEKL